jgi:hypothetical protein
MHILYVLEFSLGFATKAHFSEDLLRISVISTMTFGDLTLALALVDNDESDKTDNGEPQRRCSREWS